VEDNVLDVFRQRERQRLEVANDLVDVFDDARNCLVLVDDPVDAEGPHRRPTEGRQEHPAHRVAERMTKTALQRLEAEFSDVWVVFALCGFDQLWPDEPAQINRVCH